MIEIEPVPKRYAWGSRTGLQRLFRLDAADAAADAGADDARPRIGTRSGPLAEMWFSGHAGSPSTLRVPGASAGTPDRLVGLDEAIREDPDAMVGPVASRAFGPVLPYLFKVIAARIPLSLQVHPVDFEARAGFNREQAAGIPLAARERSFKDTVAKHEMVVALEPFEAAVGFMPVDAARAALDAVDHPLTARIRAMLDASSASSGGDAARADVMMPVASMAWPRSHRMLFRAFHVAVTADPDAAAGLGRALADAAVRMQGTRARGDAGARPDRIALVIDDARKAADAFPDDPSVAALLLMNPVRLDVGESVFIPAGVPHAYIHGMAAEIMTNSDNVLRAGMTPKHRDIPNLLHSLDCTPGAPIDPRSRQFGAFIARNLVTYRPKLAEYMLAYGRAGTSSAWTPVRRLVERYGLPPMRPDAPRRATPLGLVGRLALPQHGPRVVLCTSGAIRCRDATGEMRLEQGQAAFVPADAGAVLIDGAGVPGSFLYASTPF